MASQIRDRIGDVFQHLSRVRRVPPEPFEETPIRVVAIAVCLQQYCPIFSLRSFHLLLDTTPVSKLLRFGRQFKEIESNFSDAIYGDVEVARVRSVPQQDLSVMNPIYVLKEK